LSKLRRDSIGKSVIVELLLWVTPQRLNVMCQRFGSVEPTLAISSQLFFLFKSLIKMEQAECSETSVQKIRKPENNPNKEHNIHNMAKFCNKNFSRKYKIIPK
jgi:hypothetical protein